MLLNKLPVRERIAVFLDFATGARRGELQGVKWEDVNFESAVLQIKRSIVKQHVGKPKTEASEKPIPLSPRLVQDLLAWRHEASPFKKGKQPYWMARIMQHNIKHVLAANLNCCATRRAAALHKLGQSDRPFRIKM